MCGTIELDCTKVFKEPTEISLWPVVLHEFTVPLLCCRHKKEFYIHGSMHRESSLITVQQDATYSVYYISVGSSTYFGC